MSDSPSDIEKPKQEVVYPEEHNTDATSPPAPEFGPAPDGGSKAWLVACGACCIFFAGLGFSNSTGVFIEYYMTHQLSDRSADDIAWIGSLSNFIQFVSGAVGGPLFDRYGAWVIRPAAIIYIFAIMMTSLCHEYWQFMLAQGVALGIGMGGLMFPAMAAVAQWFDKKRSAALGISIAGSSIGGVVIPIAFSKMLNSSSIGFGWSVRIVGFIMVPFLAFACVVVVPRVPPRVSTLFVGTAFKQADFAFAVAAMFFMFLGVFTPLFYIPSYAVTKGVDATLASYFLAIINAASIFGRVIPGILADKLGPANVLSAAGIVTGIIVCCLTQATTTAGIVVYCIFIGFSSGTVVSGGSALLASTTKNPQLLGAYMGSGMAVASVAVLIGPPINGRLLDNNGFLAVALFSGVSCLIGGVIAIFCRVFKGKTLS